MSILEVKSLSVVLNNKEILRDINFSLNEGEILIVVGPNGGGKTTLLKAILNIIPYSGEIYIKESYKLGYVPQNLENVSNLPICVFEMFKLFTNASNKRIEEIMEFFKLKEYKDELFKNLSGGQKQKVLISIAILKDSKILLLDEPTNNLDINSQTEFYKLIRELREKYGVSFIIVSHDIGIVNSIADKVLCLNKIMYYHGNRKIDEEIIKKLYQSDVKIMLHDH